MNSEALHPVPSRLRSIGIHHPSFGRRAMHSCALILLVTGTTPAFAWGASGHRMVSCMAIENLPPEVPAFLREEKVAEMIGEIANEPDRLRGAGTSHDRSNSPAHFINLDDDFLAADSVSIDPLPATREEFDTALRAARSNEYRTGFLPYAIVDGWQQVQKDFAYWRSIDAKERKATTRVARTRLAKERQLREMLTVRDIGYWSHFVGDASQPMHVSIHADGWSDRSNPRGYRTSKGLHNYLEATFVTRYVKAAEVRKQLPPFHDCACSIETRTVNYLRDSHRQIVPLYALEKEGAFSPTPAGQEFVTHRLAVAVAEVRDLIVSAWRESEHIVVDEPTASIREQPSRKTKLRKMQDTD